MTHIAPEDSFSSAHGAAFIDSEQLFDKLLGGAASLTVRTSTGITPLHCGSRVGKMNSIRFLLKNDVDVNAQDRDGDTPLMLAAKYFHIEAVKVLLAADADPSLCDSFELAPLDYTGHYQPIKDAFLEKCPLLKFRSRQEQRPDFENMLSRKSWPKISVSKTKEIARTPVCYWAFAS